MRNDSPHIISVVNLIFNEALRFTLCALSLPQEGIFFGFLPYYFAGDGNSETHACCEK
jgi:hypothetical protein